MKKILTEALAVANATSTQPAHDKSARSIAGMCYYPGSSWSNFTVHQRLRVRDADPDGHARGRETVPSHRLTALIDATVGVFLRRYRDHARDGNAPAAVSVREYLFAMLDADKQYFDGSKTYKVTLPKGYRAEANFAVLHAL